MLCLSNDVLEYLWSCKRIFVIHAMIGSLQPIVQSVQQILPPWQGVKLDVYSKLPPLCLFM